MNHYILGLEQEYRELANLYQSLLDAGFYDGHRQRQVEDRERLQRAWRKIDVENGARVLER
jgi:hypothetical protein